MLTFLPADAIADLEARIVAKPELRAAQKVLAREMTSLVHGADVTAAAVAASEILFGGSLDGIAEATFEEVVDEVPTHKIARERLSGGGLPIVDLLVLADLARSKTHARTDLDAGGVSLNNARVDRSTRLVTVGDLLFGKYLLLRRGRRTYTVVIAR